MSDSTVFVDFLRVNKTLRKKLYQNTNDFAKLARVLGAFQARIRATSEVTGSRTAFGFVSDFTFL